MVQTKVYNERFKGQKAAKWMKPARYAHYKTLKELACALHVDPKTLRRLERAGIIPETVRVSRGRLAIRLYSPELESDIAEILEKKEYRKKPGRKSNG